MGSDYRRERDSSRLNMETLPGVSSSGGSHSRSGPSTSRPSASTAELANCFGDRSRVDSHAPMSSYPSSSSRHAGSSTHSRGSEVVRRPSGRESSRLGDDLVRYGSRSGQLNRSRRHEVEINTPHLNIKVTYHGGEADQ